MAISICNCYPLWIYLNSSCFLQENRIIQLLQNLLQPLFAKQLNSQSGSIQDRKRRMEQIVDFQPAAHDATVFKQTQILGLLRTEILRDQPSMEILRQLFFLTFELEIPQRRFDEIDQSSVWAAVGAT